MFAGGRAQKHGDICGEGIRIDELDACGAAGVRPDPSVSHGVANACGGCDIRDGVRSLRSSCTVPTAHACGAVGHRNACGERGAGRVRAFVVGSRGGSRSAGGIMRRHAAHDPCLAFTRSRGYSGRLRSQRYREPRSFVAFGARGLYGVGYRCGRYRCARGYRGALGRGGGSSVGGRRGRRRVCFGFSRGGLRPPSCGIARCGTRLA